MADLITEPIPHTEAAEAIRAMPAVVRSVWNELLPELRARAFTVTGVEDASVLQALRDAIASLPEGADWDEVQGELIQELEPWLGDGAQRRAELLLRLHGGVAYSAASYRMMDRQRDVFPYWMYRSMGDDRVRDAHRALDGLVLPAHSKFWERHFPPWEWGCRCTVIPISEEDADAIRLEDADKPLEARRVIEGEALQQVEQGRLVRGPNQIYDLRTPREKGKPGGWEWSPGELRLPLETLRQRYDAEVWAKFEEWARATKIDTNRTVWQWLTSAA